MPIPYIELSEIVVLRSPPLSLKPFGILVATGVYLGAWCAMRYGRKRGLDPRALASFILHVVGIGFICGHALDVVFYAPERLLTDPWALVRVWDGLSSFGGFIGGGLGALLWRRRQRVAVLPYADVVASALPLGWVFGRAGCALVHDHPGIASQAWFAVDFPGGARLDLGLIEMALTVPIAIAFLFMQRRAWPWGFLLGCLCVVYAPLRFGLDFLRIDQPVNLPHLELQADRRYAALTPAQWASLLLGAFGFFLLRRSLASAEGDSAFAAPSPPPAFVHEPRAATASPSEADLEGGGHDSSSER